ncbi:proline racemase family protein [Ferruginivarius sediminum]|uniref:Proline racemase n=1 Tax=Ferruginivarius sediminum TaxID=2661937 RepID=A0A369THT2_9PROT|nr:proline racemase family protein [Ferruginivarius sediminum]RDD62456.1 proline racemase [Ferruginivarius sediminum]
MARARRASLSVIDLHAAGDVSRVVTSGIRTLPGDSLLEAARFLEYRADGLRRLLLSEPHGRPEMSANLIVPPRDPRARAGHIIMETMGYPGFSGSNTICTATALAEAGNGGPADGANEFELEAPVGTTRVTVQACSGRAVGVTYEAGPAYVARMACRADVAEHGSVVFDLVWSGVLYAVVDAAALGLALDRESVPALKEFARRFLQAARPAAGVPHTVHGQAGPLSFVLLTGRLEPGEDGVYQRDAAVYVRPDVIRRSPTGTGTSAQLALLAADGVMEAGARLRTVSPFGGTFTGELLGDTSVGNHPAVLTAITGRAWTLARSEIVVDLADPLIEDAGLSAILGD